MLTGVIHPHSGGSYPGISRDHNSMAKKFTKKRSAKKAFSKSKRGYSKKVRLSVPKSIVSTGIGFPKKLLMTHKYQETFQLTNTAGVFNSYFFSANGLFDPNSTGTGHQPMYYDQLVALYNHYVVVGAKCVFKFTPTGVTTQSIRACCTLEDQGSLSATSLDMLGENTQARGQFFLPAGNNVAGRRTLKYSAKKMFGKSIMANSNLRGSASTNPSEGAFFCFASQGDGVASTGLNVIAEITYSTVWFELRDVVGS